METRNASNRVNFFYKRLMPLAMLFIIFQTHTFSQTTELIFISSGKHLLPDFIKPLQKSFTDSTSAYISINKTIKELINKGYASAITDSVIKSGNKLEAYINSGPMYKSFYITKSKDDNTIFENAGISKKILQPQIFRYDRLKYIAEKTIKYLENNGYPFASFFTDSISINPDNNEISAVLKIRKGPLIITDSLIIDEKAGISSSFIGNYLGIKQGMPYNEKKIIEAEQALRQLPFLNITSAPELSFTDEKVKIYIKAKKRSSGDFSGILGFMPDYRRENKIHFSGELNLRLQNTLKYGELLAINWRKNDALSQDLKTHAEWPFVFSLPIGIENKFNLLKRDTSYININNRLSIKYHVKAHNFFKAFYESRQSRLLSTAGMEKTIKLPSHADISSQFYGIELYSGKFNNKLNPVKGHSILMNGSAGSRKILQNNKVNPVVYESLDLKTTQYRAEGETSLFIPITNRSTTALFCKGGIISGQTLFINELYRIGGLNTLRGFDEESISASHYVIASIEYRYLLDEASFIQLFFDGAYYEKRTTEGFNSDTPYGFGAGISFETSAGLFSLNYALGSEENNPVNMRTGKIHFGLKTTIK